MGAFRSAAWLSPKGPWDMDASEFRVVETISELKLASLFIVLNCCCGGGADVDKECNDDKFVSPVTEMLVHSQRYNGKEGLLLHPLVTCKVDFCPVSFTLTATKQKYFL